MNHRDVIDLIEEGEGFTVEFKRKVSSAEKIARTIISFANTTGGTILFGVDDDGSIVGVESEKAEIDLIQTAGQEFCDPPIIPHIDVIAVDAKDVIACQVNESRSKPHFFLGEHHPNDKPAGESVDNTRVYIRVNDKSVAASREVVRILEDENPEAPPLKVSIGENERRLFNYLERDERITVREFGRLINVSDRRASRILVRLVRAGVVRIHTHERDEFFTLAHDIQS